MVIFGMEYRCFNLSFGLEITLLKELMLQERNKYLLLRSKRVPHRINDWSILLIFYIKVNELLITLES